jgi:hypothetical protein
MSKAQRIAFTLLLASTLIASWSAFHAFKWSELIATFGEAMPGSLPFAERVQREMKQGTRKPDARTVELLARHIRFQHQDAAEDRREMRDAGRRAAVGGAAALFLAMLSSGIVAWEIRGRRRS